VTRPGAVSEEPGAILGNAVVLERPLRRAILANALEMALRARRQQYARRDAEERSALVDQLQLERDRLERAQAAGNIGVFEWYIDDERGEWSPALEALYGYLPGEFDRDKFWAAVHPDDVTPLKQALARISAGSPDLAHEFRLKRGDRVLRWILVRGRIVKGKPRSLAGVVIDITDRKVSEQALREAQKRESIVTLAGGIAHDFNNLLATILGNASLALEEVSDPQSVRLALERIVTASENAAGLTRQLLAYAGKGTFVIEKVNLSELISRNEGLIRSALPGTVELRFRLAPNPPPVEGDPGLLEQLVMNLVINAAEAVGTERTGVVEISTLVEGEAVCLEVCDNGPGMDESVKTRIFDPFFSTKFPGRGLGLAAVSGIVRAFRGAIRVDTAPGRGSTFHVCLPARASARRLTEEEVQPPAKLTGSGLVLVVEDEQPVLEVTGAALRRYGYSVAPAHDGAEALALYQRYGHKIRAVVLDLSMPLISGEELLAALHARNPQIPVLISTGHSDFGLNELSAVHPNIAFIEKPYTPRQLAGKLKALLHIR
jgi:PAS domain S-box-containing protein